MIRNCRFCDVELSQDNWCIGNIKQKQYKCKTCDGIVGRQNYLKRKAKQLSSYSVTAFNRVKEGYVYAITNSAWQGWIKIGMAVDAEDRLKGYQTSSPFRDYELLHKSFFKNKRRAEAKAHKLAGEIAYETRGEWFNISKDKAINIINSIDNVEKTGIQDIKEVFI